MDNKAVDAYLKQRSDMGCASRQGDDRRHPDKWMRDAELRGKIGDENANRIIRAIDTVRSYR